MQTNDYNVAMLQVAWEMTQLTMKMGDTPNAEKVRSELKKNYQAILNARQTDTEK